ncbi:MAG: sodium:proton antiporter [Lachnospiraceae bacterium]|nr:sodium:proton antiporter [Lachnospiraceae bacterium]MBR4816199.1 sodium:proton antiporter [Lachnospiraceae bacterium]
MNGNIMLINLILWPISGAFICYLAGWKGIKEYNLEDYDGDDARLRKTFRDFLVVCAVILECLLYALCIYSSGKNGNTLHINKICGLGINLRFGGFRTIYVGVALLMWTATALFSREYFAHYHNRNRYYFFYLITLGATLGVFMSDDLYTAFIFFEVMSFTSYTWVAHDEKPGAMKAAGTYLAVAVIGGLVMLMGIMMLYHKLGTIQINELCAAAGEVLGNSNSGDTAYMFAAGICILFGFGAKAGMFPLHIWLPKAHPVAPAPASALLSGILTKSGVYGVLILCFEIFRENKSWGILILVLGVITMFTGAVLAVFSIDLKRTLACSSMSQIGFILTGCAFSVLLGEENSLAAAGTVLYMVNHSLFKLVLFMCAGAVYAKLHKLDLNEIRGFGRGNKFLMVMFAIGALGIMGVPLFSGYLSKTLIHEGIVEYAHELTGGAHTIIKLIEYLFLLSGGMTIGYMIKLFIAIFIEKPANTDKAVKWSIGSPSKLALIMPACIIVVCGVYPPIYVEVLSKYMSDITRAHAIGHFEAFSLENLKGFVISLTIGLLVYLFIRKVLMKEKNGVKVYVNRWPAKLDLEELIYRPLLLKLLPGLFIGIFKGLIKLTEIIWNFMVIAPGKFFTGLIAFTKLIWEWLVKIGKGIGYAASFFGEAVIYSIRKIFFKNLEEDKTSPIMEKLYAKFDAGDRVLRIVEATISYSIIWLMLGLIGTILFLLFYK